MKFELIDRNVNNGQGDIGEGLTRNGDANTEGTVEIQSAVETRYPCT